MSEIHNAKITGTMLGIEDHGLFTSFIYLDWEGGGIGVGGYLLGGESGIKFIEETLKVVGVGKWEDLKGRYCRVETDGWGAPARGIGNILKDEWLYPKEFFAKFKEACAHERVVEDFGRGSHCKDCGEEL